MSELPTESSRKIPAIETPNNEDSKRSRKFELSWFNKLLLVLCSIGHFVFGTLAFFGSDRGLSPEQSGKLIADLTGSFLAFALFPTFCGWIVWLISGRRPVRWGLTFTIVFMLLLVGKIGQIGRDIRLLEAHEKVVEAKADLRSGYDESKSTTENSREIKKYETQILQSVEETLSVSSGEEKLLLNLVADFLQEVRVRGEVFTEIAAINQADSLEPEVLRQPGEIDRQIQNTQSYIEASKNYLQFIISSTSEFRNKLSKLAEQQSRSAKRALKRFNKKDKIVGPIKIDLFKSHIHYGEIQLKLLQFMQAHPEEWDEERDDYISEETPLSKKLYEILLQLAESEEQINIKTAEIHAAAIP